MKFNIPKKESAIGLAVLCIVCLLCGYVTEGKIIGVSDLAIVICLFCSVYAFELLEVKKNWFVKILAIPSMLISFIGISPILLIGILPMLFPLLIFALLTFIIPLIFKQLTYLQLGNAFNQNVIPYLSLTTIFLVFIYLERPLIQLVKSWDDNRDADKRNKHSGNRDILIPFAQYLNFWTSKNSDDKIYGWKNYFKNLARAWGLIFRILEMKPFMKIAYFLFVAFTIVSTIEKLGDIHFFNYFVSYQNIVFQSLVTFTVIDRLVSKWKN
jgi:hypothetical protein